MGQLQSPVVAPCVFLVRIKILKNLRFILEFEPQTYSIIFVNLLPTRSNSSHVVKRKINKKFYLISNSNGFGIKLLSTTNPSSSKYLKST
jgi:hypothetical protein